MCMTSNSLHTAQICIYVPGTHGGQKRALDGPGWKLQVTVSNHWVLGIEPQVVVLCKNN